jgi:hypothetical protein
MEKRVSGVAQLVEHLLSKHGTLSVTPKTAQPFPPKKAPEAHISIPKDRAEDA